MNVRESIRKNFESDNFAAVVELYNQEVLDHLMADLDDVNDVESLEVATMTASAHFAERKYQICLVIVDRLLEDFFKHDAKEYDEEWIEGMAWTKYSCMLKLGQSIKAYFFLKRMVPFLNARSGVRGVYQNEKTKILNYAFPVIGIGIPMLLLVFGIIDSIFDLLPQPTDVVFNFAVVVIFILSWVLKNQLWRSLNRFF